MPGQDLTAGHPVKGRTAIPNGQETALQIDPATGYAVSSRTDRITLDQKLLIVAKYRETGNLSECCRLAGVTLRHLRQLRGADEQLNNDLHEVELGFVEYAKGYMLQHMARPGNYMDRVTIARRFEPGVWGNTVDVNVKHSLERVTDLAEKARAYQARQPGELDSPDKGEATSTP